MYDDHDIEEDYEVAIPWNATQGFCICCQERTCYSEDAFSLGVFTVFISGGLTFVPLVLEDDPYPARVFDMDCWESCEEELREAKENEPPIYDDFAILDCGVCESGIREGEILGVISFGEVQRSTRNADNMGPSDTFVSMDPDPLILCVACLNTLDTDIVQDLWDFRIVQHTECTEGTFTRCWRHGCSADGNCLNRREGEEE